MAMSNPYRDDRRATFAYPQTTFLPDSPTSLGSIIFAVLASAYVLFKVLDLLGYPVWLWFHQAVQMSFDSLPSLGESMVGLFGDDSDSGDDTHSRGGNMLSSVFGLGNGGLLRGVTGALSKGYNNAPPGLGNWDNSCYQNSVIQGLASLPSLREYLSKTTAEYKTLGDESTNGALFEMINRLNSTDNHGQHFWIKGKLKSMSTFQQQDAQEYYSKIMDALDKEVQDATNSKKRSTASWLLTAKSLGDSPVISAEKDEGSKSENQPEDSMTPAVHPQPFPNPLDGLLAQRVGCVNCGYSEGLSLIPFNCVTVPLGRNWNYDVRDCLDEYTSLEFIQGVECAKCTLIKAEGTLSKVVKSPDSPFAPRLRAVQEALEEEDFDDKTLIKKCNIAKKNWVQSTKSRQAVIARAPKSLVLHVNRSIFDEMTGAQYKNTAAVSYPKILDLGTWCLGSQPSHSQLVDESVEQWPRDPKESMLGGADTVPTTDSPFQYTLRAAVTHFGSHGNGHYVCYRNQPYPVKKDPPSDSEDTENVEDKAVTKEEWWRLSDENVSAISEVAALRQGGVFMLFYERLDAHSNAQPTSGASVKGVSECIPLPPQETCLSRIVIDHSAADVPLPEDDEDIFPMSPPESPGLPVTIPYPSIDLVEESELYERIPDLIDVNTIAYPTPPPESLRTIQQEDTEISDGDSDDAPSTELTSDDDTEREFNNNQSLLKEFSETPPSHTLSTSPHWMRTAGDAPGREKESRASLPMVTAT